MGSTSVPVWWGSLIIGEAMHEWRQRVDRKALYFPLDFAVNLKILLKKVFKKKIAEFHQGLNGMYIIL